MITARANPLRMDRLELLPFRFSSGHWDSHLQRLANLNYRGAIVGRKGSGKTTLLLELQKRLTDSVYLSLPFDRSRHQAILGQAIEQNQAGKLLLIDSLERASWFNRRKLHHQCRERIVVTVHRSSSLPTWIHCCTDLQLMLGLIEELGLSTAEVNRAAVAAFSKSRGNIRDAFRLLYDQFSEESLPVPN